MQSDLQDRPPNGRSELHMAGPDYIVDIDGIATSTSSQGGPGAAGHGGSFHGRPWLAVQWRCCEVYSRIYRSRDATAYAGTCPGCGKPVRVRIGPDGTHARFFEAQ